MTGSNLAPGSSPKRKSDLAPLEQLGVLFGHHHGRAGHPFQFSQPGGVIEVAVGRGENLDIRQLESQLLNACFDLWDCLSETRINENVPPGRCDQVRGKIVSPDPVHVSDHPKGREGPDPVQVGQRLGGLPESVRHERRQHRKRGNGK